MLCYTNVCVACIGNSSDTQLENQIRNLEQTIETMKQNTGRTSSLLFHIYNTL